VTLHEGPDHLREVGQKALGVTGVHAVDVVRHDGRLDRPVLELTVGEGYDRVPPRVLRHLAEHDVGVYSIAPRADWYMILAV